MESNIFSVVCVLNTEIEFFPEVMHHCASLRASRAGFLDLATGFHVKKNMENSGNAMLRLYWYCRRDGRDTL
jgi:hypothetical protein